MHSCLNARGSGIEQSNRSRKLVKKDDIARGTPGKDLSVYCGKEKKDGIAYILLEVANARNSARC